MTGSHINTGHWGTEPGEHSPEARELRRMLNLRSEKQTSDGDKGRQPAPSGGGSSSGPGDHEDSGKDEGWDELCIGFWRQSKVRRLKGSPGECKGISILRAESEVELQKMKKSHATGIRIVIITAKEEAQQAQKQQGLVAHQQQQQHQTQTATQAPHHPANVPAVPGPRVTLGEILFVRLQQGVSAAVALATDPEYKKSVQENLYKQAEKQVDLAKRVADKIVSGDVIRKTATTAQRTLSTQAAHAAAWFRNFGNPKDV
eukprot:comp15112_c0_seq1/m.11786 comp15112_c0_seq1/g.11786  ORF comp15112_c0_seq1/g.11786 comp15112_c0_seq1/m.11786 type:complete len:259 (-) comp15112_c0_seq1:295-1071(-)